MILGDVIPYNRIKKENFKAKVYTYTLRLCVLKMWSLVLFLFFYETFIFWNII